MEKDEFAELVRENLRLTLQEIERVIEDIRPLINCDPSIDVEGLIVHRANVRKALSDLGAGRLSDPPANDGQG